MQIWHSLKPLHAPLSAFQLWPGLTRQPPFASFLPCTCLCSLPTCLHVLSLTCAQRNVRRLVASLSSTKKTHLGII